MRHRTILVTVTMVLIGFGISQGIPVFMSNSLVSAQNGEKLGIGYMLVNPDPAPDAKMTDTVRVAIARARAIGMTDDPVEIRVKRGLYKDFLLPGESDSFYDSKEVYAVWLQTKPFQVVAPGARKQDSTQLVFFIDLKNGHSFAFSYGSLNDPQMETKTWEKATLADGTKYPIPEFDPDNLIPVDIDSNAMPEPTETPIK